MQARIDSPDYWLDGFQAQDHDMSELYEFMIEAAEPQEIEALAARLVRRRVERELAARKARADAKGTVYKPADRYDVGQKLTFSAIDGLEGVVKSVRKGNNPAFGDYEVIQVKLGGAERSFAAGLTVDHALSETETDLDAGDLAERYGPVIVPPLAMRLSDDVDWLHYGDRWVLRALLPEINLGHRNLAEAVIMLAGEPLPAEQIMNDLDLDSSVPAETRAIALELALSSDGRFRNVGALEAPLWTLKSQL